MKKFKDTKHRDKILSRIKKILALADRTSFEEEANTALRMAKGLMKSYGLNLSEVEMVDEIKGNIIEDTTETSGRIMNWKKITAMAVEKICDTKLIINHVGKNRVNLKFIGYKEDVKLSLTLYSTFTLSMANMANKSYSDRFRKRSYLIGLADRLVDRAIEESKQALDDTPKYGALVVVKENEISEYIKDLELTSKTMKNKINTEAYNKGYADGDNLDLHNKGRIGY